ncbi:pentatricopeptide repeat-containing protein 1, mitochondrial-like, partial [Mizuhopecten yessoensis]|uniref:pentatricopeptide repeat-containing protein 1, mitochondrial-like n=1 Tax=Mizuhopecten yessoensis TaxID=6573 RepID=UPI000B45B1B6
MQHTCRMIELPQFLLGLVTRAFNCSKSGNRSDCSQCQKIHTTTSYWRGKERSKRNKDEQISFFRKSNTYVADQKGESGNDRKSNKRKNDFPYRHDELQGSSDYHTRRDHHRNHSMRKDKYNVGQHYNEQKEAVQSPEIQDTNELDDNFGNLSRDVKGTLPKWLQDENLGESYEMEKPHRPLLVENRRHNQDWYFKKIVKMGKEGKVLEAIAVLDDWMLVRDRVMPNEDIYTAIIGIIGRTGNASLAFAHFKK